MVGGLLGARAGAARRSSARSSASRSSARAERSLRLVGGAPSCQRRRVAPRARLRRQLLDGRRRAGRPRRGLRGAPRAAGQAPPAPATRPLPARGSGSATAGPAGSGSATRARSSRCTRSSPTASTRSSTRGSPSTIVDLGANVGQAALWFRSRFPDARILCVEADPQTRSRSSSATSASDPLITLRNAAVTAKDGTVMLERTDRLELGHARVGRREDGVSVPGLSLETLLDEHQHRSRRPAQGRHRGHGARGARRQPGAGAGRSRSSARSTRTCSPCSVDRGARRHAPRRRLRALGAPRRHLRAGARVAVPSRQSVGSGGGGPGGR